MAVGRVAITRSGGESQRKNRTGAFDLNTSPSSCLPVICEGHVAFRSVYID